ncbi:PGPGW domain-containing protein [Aporhodopirellula aestuarii]|uniref:Transmembrane protein (PGPGW) n=1 Tax=Aporhodopirellula aestuarii TaxID=2950107 RepID=A0ABT0UEK6_9BACT|nr:PGPGW domain-containing protein [Aporhodopirellula aestuarii]MCM2375182.1 hypothetical protein [Aporhodopirellula aestuarii]
MILHLTLLALKNTLGVFLLVIGISMLVLPGQGLLTILIGLSLLDFPGKYRLERYLVTRPPVFKSLNWLRQRAGNPPFEMPGQPKHHSGPPSDSAAPTISRFLTAFDSKPPNEAAEVHRRRHSSAHD